LAYLPTSVGLLLSTELAAPWLDNAVARLLALVHPEFNLVLPLKQYALDEAGTCRSMLSAEVQRVTLGGSTLLLLQAVEEDSIDMLAVQAPECRVLPQHILDLLSQARTNILIFHLPHSQKQVDLMSSFNSKAMLGAGQGDTTAVADVLAVG
jgi:hypothetical protein